MKPIIPTTNLYALLLVGWFTLTCVASVESQVRTWTRNDGKTVEATLEKMTAIHAVLKLSNGNFFKIRVSQLTSPDHEYIAEWFSGQKGVPRNITELNSPTLSPAAPARPGIFPIPDPTKLPALPVKHCRLVIVETHDAHKDSDKRAFKKIEEDDLTDLVKLGDRMVDRNVVAIQAGGKPLMWRNDGEVITDRGARNVVAVFNDRSSAPLVWLKSDGSVGAITKNEALSTEIRRLHGVVYIATMDDAIFTIDDKGERKFMGGSGKMRSSNIRLAKEKISTIARFGRGLTRSFHVLTTNGRFDHFKEGRLLRGDKERGAVDFVSSRIAVAPDGTFFTCSGLFGFNKRLKEVRSIHRVTHGGGLVAIQEVPGGRWMIWNGQNDWGRDSRLEQLFGDAGDLQFNFDKAFYALLPAESVPRSGLWKLDQLISAR